MNNRNITHKENKRLDNIRAIINNAQPGGRNWRLFQFLYDYAVGSQNSVSYETITRYTCVPENYVSDIIRAYRKSQYLIGSNENGIFLITNVREAYIALDYIKHDRYSIQSKRDITLGLYYAMKREKWQVSEDCIDFNNHDHLGKVAFKNNIDAQNKLPFITNLQSTINFLYPNGYVRKVLQFLVQNSIGHTNAIKIKDIAKRCKVSPQFVSQIIKDNNLDCFIGRSTHGIFLIADVNDLKFLEQFYTKKIKNLVIKRDKIRDLIINN